jgi:hypothetical protein
LPPDNVADYVVNGGPLCDTYVTVHLQFAVWHSAAAQILPRWGTMYSRLDPVEISNQLGLDDYVASLAAKHANLEKAIQDEAQRPAPNTLSLGELKRRKLWVKDQIFMVKARTSARRSRA